MQIRPAEVADLQRLRTVYAESVERLGPGAYTPPQVAAWKAFADDPAFERFVFDVHTYVAIGDAAIDAFCGIADDGHVAALYVTPERSRQGLGTALLRAVLALHPVPASGRYYAEASHFSLAPFERCGFHLAGIEHTERGGVAFQRFLVERPAARNASGGAA